MTKSRTSNPVFIANPNINYNNREASRYRPRGLDFIVGGISLRRTKYKNGGMTIGETISKALITVTITVINFWGKSKKKRR